MPTGICTVCSKAKHWRNTRGARLANMSCDCGGKLVRAEYDSAKGWIPATPRTRQFTNQKRVTCAVCGQPRMFPGGYCHELKHTESYEYQLKRIILPAGAIVCGSHAPLILTPMFNSGL